MLEEAEMAVSQLKGDLAIAERERRELEEVRRDSARLKVLPSFLVHHCALPEHSRSSHIGRTALTPLPPGAPHGDIPQAGHPGSTHQVQPDKHGAAGPARHPHQQ